MLSCGFAQWSKFPSALATLTELLRDGTQFLTTIPRSRAALGAEVLFFESSCPTTKEHEIPPRRLTDTVRLSLVLWSKFFDWKESLAIVTAETFIRWHRNRCKFYWRRWHGDRPALPKEIRRLIAGRVEENITWGEEWIAGSRRILHYNVTAHPTADWTLEQFSGDPTQ